MQAASGRNGSDLPSANALHETEQCLYCNSVCAVPGKCPLDARRCSKISACEARATRTFNPWRAAGREGPRGDQPGAGRPHEAGVRPAWCSQQPEGTAPPPHSDCLSWCCPQPPAVYAAKPDPGCCLPGRGGSAWRRAGSNSRNCPAHVCTCRTGSCASCACSRRCCEARRLRWLGDWGGSLRCRGCGDVSRRAARPLSARLGPSPVLRHGACMVWHCSA